MRFMACASRCRTDDAEGCLAAASPNACRACIEATRFIAGLSFLARMDVSSNSMVHHGTILFVCLTGKPRLSLPGLLVWAASKLLIFELGLKCVVETLRFCGEAPVT
jgi:hypothetical protein